ADRATAPLLRRSRDRRADRARRVPEHVEQVQCGAGGTLAGLLRIIVPMSELQQWAFPDALQPKPGETQFDLTRAFDAVVLVRAEVPEDGYTAANLGTERGGYGAVIREDGLVLTIGYLINEASQIWLTTNRGQVVEGYPLAYDHMTGFGLIQPLGKLDAPHVPRGLAADAKIGDAAFVIGHGGPGHSLKTRI